MAERSNNINPRKSADYGQANRQGMLETPGPFVGIVKWNIDPTRAGRLQVYIPDLGNPDPEDRSGWYTVTYASPFRGKTQGKVNSLSEYYQQGTYEDATAEEENSFQSYGFWFVPPDIGIRVLCFFVNGDPAQGYWFACINDPFDSYMTPGMGSAPASAYIWKPGSMPTHEMLQQWVELPSGEIPSRLPVAEPTREAQQSGGAAGGVKIDNIDDVKKYPLVFQTYKLGQQGLCFDFTRGTTSTTSTRESPSNCYGISTPGRYWMMKDEPKSQEYLSGGDEKLILKNFRIGGHQLILDDGTMEGLDQMIKIRSSKGNMILLDDTNEQIYIINSRGTAWVEMSPEGKIDIYSDQDFSLRTKGNINFHTEQDFNLHARGNINVKTEKTTNWESVGNYTVKTDAAAKLFSKSTMEIGTSSTLNVYSQAAMSVRSESNLIIKGSMVYINTQPGNTVSEPPDIVEQKHPETKQVGGRKTWWVEGEFKSIVPRAPDHEPWKNHEKYTVKAVTPSPASSDKSVGPRPSDQGGNG